MWKKSQPKNVWDFTTSGGFISLFGADKWIRDLLDVLVLDVDAASTATTGLFFGLCLVCADLVSSGSAANPSFLPGSLATVAAQGLTSGSTAHSTALLTFLAMAFLFLQRFLASIRVPLFFSVFDFLSPVSCHFLRFQSSQNETILGRL